MSDKYLPVRLADDWEARLHAMPVQCWWAAEDEPMVRFPNGAILPQSVAVAHGAAVKESDSPAPPAQPTPPRLTQEERRNLLNGMWAEFPAEPPPAEPAPEAKPVKWREWL